MKKPTKQRLLKQISTVKTIPPPTGGWNRRDPLPGMPPEDAIVLDNLIPGRGSAALRRGYASHATGLGSFVESLMEYGGVGGTNKLFGATPTAIYNVTASGAVGAAELSSLTNGRWQHTMFATAAGNYLVIANGADAVRNYDGSSWSTPSITNVTSSTLATVTAHAERLWFIENNTLNVWYLPAAAIAGAATKFPLGSFCRLGGYLLAMGSWSRDGGAGPDDMAVFITSKGEVVVYSGSDPSSASTWSRVGTFRIPEPIGRRCLIKAGADLGALTSLGILPMSEVLDNNISGQSQQAITNKISGAFQEAYATVGGSFGWQVAEYPREKLLLVNVPIAERVTQHQYVLNIETGAWCRFLGVNAGCWAMMGSNLYFGGNNGVVYKYGVDYLDGTSTISATVQQAFSNFGVVGNKQFKAARPLVRAPEGYTPSVQLKLDYDTTAPNLPATSAASSASLWDVALWDAAMWGNTSVPRSSWQGVTGIGVTASLAMTLSLAQEFVLNQTDIMYEPGGYL